MDARHWKKRQARSIQNSNQKTRYSWVTGLLGDVKGKLCKYFQLALHYSASHDATPLPEPKVNAAATSFRVYHERGQAVYRAAQSWW